MAPVCGVALGHWVDIDSPPTIVGGMVKGPEFVSLEAFSVGLVRGDRRLE